jgi:tRNA1Val (adenine37-N6)-methyltransferase
MKVGTDGVLLGAWTDVEKAKNILDVGTGTGLIALMLAQRTENSQIDAIEIDEQAFVQASENVSKTNWKDRIHIFHNDFLHFNADKKYDLIVSNPPYFSNSLKNPNEKRTLARHTDSLTPIQLLQASKNLLQTDGRLSLILPSTEGYELIKIAEKESLFCAKLTKVIPKIGAQEKRLLMEFSFQKRTCTEDELLIENNFRHEYSAQYKNLTKDFYLKM